MALNVVAMNVTIICFASRNSITKIQKKILLKTKRIFDHSTKKAESTKSFFPVSVGGERVLPKGKPVLLRATFRSDLIFMEKCKKTIDKYNKSGYNM